MAYESSRTDLQAKKFQINFKSPIGKSEPNRPISSQLLQPKL